MDPFRHPFPNNNTRYVPIPPPRFPDDDPNRYLIFHSHPQHDHHRPFHPHHHHHNNNNNNTPFLPTSPYPSPHPNPPPLVFAHPPVRVFDRISSEHHIPFPFRDDDAPPIDHSRSSPRLIWEDESRRRPRSPFAIRLDRDFRVQNHRGNRFPHQEDDNPRLVSRKRYNSDLEGVEFHGRWEEFGDDSMIVGDLRNLMDPHRHRRNHSNHNHDRQVRRRTFPSDSFTSDVLESTPTGGGSHGHSSGARMARYIKPFDSLKARERNFGGGGGGEIIDESRRWTRQPSSSSAVFLNSDKEKEKEVIKEDNGIRTVSGKRLVVSKMGKGKKTVVCENKPKKTSVLLRLQASNNINRNRKEEQLVSSSYFVGSNAIASKGKGPIVFSDHRPEKGSSPVELDVSFKSNALVAKAIVAPSKPLIGSNKTSSIKIKKKKKKIVKSVSRLPSSRLAGIGSADALSSSHNPTEVSEKMMVSEAGVGSGVKDGAGLLLSQSRVMVPLEINPVPSVVDSAKENSRNNHVVCEEDGTNRLHSNAGFAECGKELAAFDMKSPPSGFEGGRQDAIPSGTVIECDEDFVEVDVKEGTVERQEQTEVGAMEERKMSCSEKCQDTAELHAEVREELDILLLEVQTSVLDQSLPNGAMEGEGCDQMDKEGLHQSDDTRPEAEAPVVSTNNSTEEIIVHVIDRLSRIDSPEFSSVVPEVESLNGDKSSDENSCMDNSKQDERTAGKDIFSLNDNYSTLSKLKVNVSSDQWMLINNHTIIEKKLPLQSMATRRPSTDLKSTGKELIGKRTPHHSSGISGSLPPRAGFASGIVKETISSTHVVRPRIWRRTDSSSASPSPVCESGLSSGPTGKQSPKKIGKVQTPSYIRKGNSLVRKSAPVSVFSQVSPGLGTLINRSNSRSEDKLKSCVPSKSKVDSTDCTTSSGVNPSFERPKTPPLPHNTKLLNCMTKNSQDALNSTLVDPLAQAGVENSAYTTLDPIKLTLSEDVFGDARSSKNRASDSLVSNIGTQSTLNGGKLKSPKGKRVIYVKRKSNQLVAAPRPEIRDSSVSITEKTHPVYYKRRKNQIVRNIVSLKSQVEQAIVIPDDGSNSESQSVPEISTLKCSRGLRKKMLDKVLEKTREPSKFSLVWTLGGSQSYNKDTTLLQRRKVLPCLFPWKRTTHRRRSITTISSVSNKSSLSLISRKLQLSRQRDTVYTRSTSGFSLRKSKVLSIGGSSLKWSKSIERRSRKVNEEATLAVAAAERKKRDQKRAASTTKAKNGNRLSRKSAHGIELQPGERIFRVGSVRYKMDSSKRTLLRISDEKSPSAVDLQSGKNNRVSYVPRRLLIGNDEYIRIGNGNQLVRDPKKLTRILASEKIRWSLHTARLRLAKKQQYCQFFTRFGTCGKDGGKCPYIHDPAKVAVCTKFLKGRCFSSNCKLTHKVIPERMPDCSYFLQGLCTNENCPYRHVNVNRDASVCEGFLRGYCADGDECRKKHTYACPEFEANGMCPQGSACKLHHPKIGNKSRKRKRSKDQRNIRKRYFGSTGSIDAGESKAVASDHQTAVQSADIFFSDGQYTDYISLDFVDEEAREANDLMDTDATLCEGEAPVDLEPENLDALIKPVHLMSIRQHDEGISIH